ncbi:MAG: hypothetical protein ABIF85_07070 [Nanoarchaeota archaeon]|nr:hypothetical protein [Nanoarchaeota archaeon]MBU4300539.1 hypothetical protein [Nanoarchaeota archaeon]MBU4451896.1 hypothetical protein [Nanoarchaeota archaeon]MCG2724180.1 hypothetical protein [archaeon]
MIFGISDSPNSRILFFTAKLDERARIIVPASIRKRLKLSFGAVVFVGIEKITDSGSAINVPETEGGESNV